MGIMEVALLTLRNVWQTTNSPMPAGRSNPAACDPASLSKEPVEVVVRTDPDPNNRIAIALTNRAVLLIDPHRPDLVIAGQLLET